MTRADNAGRLVLGTVQLGMPYGVANRTGRPDPGHALEMVRTAWDAGVRVFDTAQAYGESETVLGDCFGRFAWERDNGLPRVITKLHPDLDPLDPEAVHESVDWSLERLGLPTLYGLMMHSEAWLDVFGEGLEDLARSLKDQGKIQRFGISVYSPERAFQALQTEGIDLIQVPLNVLDQRFLEYGFFREAEEAGKETFVRSVYLQGLLLIPPGDLSRAMAYAREPLERFHRAVATWGVPPRLAALAFVLRNAPRAYHVVGAETAEQVRQNIHVYHAAGNAEPPDMGHLAVSDPRILNPALWP